MKNSGKGVDPISNARYLQCRGWIRKDPLAIDLDGDGIETLGADGVVLFDHDADGVKTGTGWVKGDDAFVVLDRNGNGQIDSGRELFGVDTLLADGSNNHDGFAALADLDSNEDRVFNSSDAQYGNVKLWCDLNQDGISQANELQSLSQAGIAAIDLAAHSAFKNLGNGNLQILAAGVVGIGTEAVALDLADNPFYREYPDQLDTSAIADLPDMQGAGSLRDLREAATQSDSLENQLRTLATQDYVNRETYRSQIEQLIGAWSGTSALDTLEDRQGLAPSEIASFEGLTTSPGMHYIQASGSGMNTIPGYYIHIVYQPVGVDRGLLEAENGLLFAGSSSGSGSGTVGTVGTQGTPLSDEQKAAQLAQWQRATHLIEVLERFNGQTFVNLEPDRVTDANGRVLTKVSDSGTSGDILKSRRWWGGTPKAANDNQWRVVA